MSCACVRLVYAYRSMCLDLLQVPYKQIKAGFTYRHMQAGSGKAIKTNLTVEKVTSSYLQLYLHYTHTYDNQHSFCYLVCLIRLIIRGMH